jgi:hypothetical protein
MRIVVFGTGGGEDILVGDWHKREWMLPLLLAEGICKP